MTPIYVHPVITRHPGRIQALEHRTGMRVVLGRGAPQLVPGSYRPMPTPPRAA